MSLTLLFGFFSGVAYYDKDSSKENQNKEYLFG